MDMPRNDVRPVELEMFSTPKHLEHASEQARARNYQDFLIVDVDSHHYENEHYTEVFDYIESPVIRAELKEGAGRRTGILNSQVGYQNTGGRIHRAKFRGKEKAKPGKHSDITLTLDWMDAMGVDYCCMFPTPMLFLGLHPQIEIEAAMCDAYNAWLCERILAQRAAHRVDALPAVQRSGGRLQDGEEVRRQEGRGRLHGDLAALPAGARQRLHEDLRAARGDGQADLVPRRLSWDDRALQMTNRFISVHALGFMWFNMIHMTNWVINGLPVRFPKLKVMWIESGLDLGLPS